MIEFCYGILMPESYAQDHKVKFTELELRRLCQKHNLYWQETKRTAGCDMICRFVKMNGESKWWNYINS